MSKDALGGECASAQPMLPGINLVQFLTLGPTFCVCECDDCPPWDHEANSCKPSCALAWLPPTRNTGVHTTRRNAAASDLLPLGEAS